MQIAGTLLQLLGTNITNSELPPQSLATNSLQILNPDQPPGVAKLGQRSRFREPRYSGPWCSGCYTETRVTRPQHRDCTVSTSDLLQHPFAFSLPMRLGPGHSSQGHNDSFQRHNPPHGCKRWSRHRYRRCRRLEPGALRLPRHLHSPRCKHSHAAPIGFAGQKVPLVRDTVS